MYIVVCDVQDQLQLVLYLVMKIWAGICDYLFCIWLCKFGQEFVIQQGLKKKTCVEGFSRVLKTQPKAYLQSRVLNAAQHRVYSRIFKNTAIGPRLQPRLHYLLWGPIDPIGTIRVRKAWAYGPIPSPRIRAYPRTIS